MNHKLSANIWEYVFCEFTNHNPCIIAEYFQKDLADSCVVVIPFCDHHRKI